MRNLLVPCGVLVFATGCPADPEPADTEASSGPTTTATASSTTGEDCSTGDCCAVNENFCPPEPSTGLPPGSSSSDGDETTAATTAIDTDTDGVPSCDIELLLAMYAQGKTEPVDCGTVTLAADTAAWVDASMCAAAAAAAQEAFYVAFEQPSIDSFIYDGYYGSVGFAYSLGRLYSDTYAEPVVTSYSCTELVIVDGCEIDVGEHCLACVGAGDPAAVQCTLS